MWREIEVTDGRRKKRERECEGPPGRPASRLDVCAGRLVLHISRRYYIHPRVNSYGQNTFNAGVCFTVLGKFHLNQSPTAKQFECASAVAGPVRPCAQELNRTCPMYEGCTRLREGASSAREGV